MAKRSRKTQRLDYFAESAFRIVQEAIGRLESSDPDKGWGTYVSVEPFHLFRYLDEQAFRFNSRAGGDGETLESTLRGIFRWRGSTGR